jgi:hypothetical protein
MVKFMANGTALSPAPRVGESPRDARLPRLITWLLIGSLFVQSLAIYHSIYIIIVSAGAVVPLVYRTLAWAPLFVICAMYVNSRQSAALRKRLQAENPGLRKLLVRLFGFVFGLGVLFGLINFNEARYFWGDLLRFIVPWMALYVGIWAFSSLAATSGAGALTTVVDGLAVLALVEALVTIGLGYAFRGHHISTLFFVFGVGWALLQHRRSGLVSTGVLAACVLATMLCSKRTTIVLVLYSALASGICLFWLRKSYWVIGRSAAICLALLVYLLVAADDNEAVEHGARIAGQASNILLGEGSRDSMEYRENEIRNIRAFYSVGDNLLWLATGCGFGCEVPSPFWEGVDETPSGNMHHVHNGFWIYLLRHGVPGIALLLVFAFMALIVPLTRLRGPYGAEIAMCLIFVSARLVSLYAGNIMLEDLDIPLVAAVGYVLSRCGGQAVPSRPDAHSAPRAARGSAARRIPVNWRGRFSPGANGLQ